MNLNQERRLRQVRKQLRRLPILDPVVDRVGSAMWRQSLKRRNPGHTWMAPGRVIRVDPNAISLGLWRLDVLEELDTPQRAALDLVQAGDWDLATFPLEDELGIFEAVRRHFDDGVPWDEIGYFDEMRESVLSGNPQFKYRSVDDFARQFDRMDHLYDTIKSEGFRSQTELGTNRPWDEIVVAFDRLGRTVFVNGRHRLAIARVLDISTVPAVVAIRHAEWVDTVGQFLTHLQEHSEGRSYQPVPHPDLGFVESQKDHTRFELIRSSLPAQSGWLLDIGSNKGYFSHRFEDAGFECWAAERSERELHFLDIFRTASQRSFTVLRGDVLKARELPHFDVVLALNIFHHFIKTGAGQRSLEEFLTTLETEYIVFEPHLPSDPQMQSSHWNPEPDEFAAFISKFARLPTITALGAAEDGRPLLLLGR